MRCKQLISLSIVSALLAASLAGCGASSGAAGVAASGAVSSSVVSSAAGSEAAAESTASLPDGVYTAEFDTDSSMFHANEACNGLGTLTVENGQMTFHVSLASKKIVNLYVGMAADAEDHKTDWSLPSVTPEDSAFWLPIFLRPVKLRAPLPPCALKRTNRLPSIYGFPQWLKGAIARPL